MDSKRTAHKHDENKRGKSTRSSSPAKKNRRLKAVGKILRREKLSEARVRLGRDLVDRAKSQNYKTEPECRIGEKCAFVTQRA